MLQDAVNEHEETLPKDGSPRDFIDAYLMEIQRTTDEKSSFYKDEGLKQLFAGIGDLFFAGSDTTSTTLSWTVLFLAYYPEIQKKLQIELDSVTGKSRSVSLADKPSLPFTEATILEILRRSSIAVVGVFHTAIQDTKFQGYDIPKDCWLLGNQYAIHHDKDIWGDPDNFRPERFLSPDGRTVLKNENLLPFSVGKRQCIGETLARDEIFLFMTNIFQRFSVQLDETKPRPSLEGQVGFIRKPEDHHVIFKDRLA
jgi:cytochrome P450